MGALVFAVLGFGLIQRGSGDRLRVAGLAVYVFGVAAHWINIRRITIYTPIADLYARA